MPALSKPNNDAASSMSARSETEMRRDERQREPNQAEDGNGAEIGHLLDVEGGRGLNESGHWFIPHVGPKRAGRERTYGTRCFNRISRTKFLVSSELATVRDVRKVSAKTSMPAGRPRGPCPLHRAHGLPSAPQPQASHGCWGWALQTHPQSSQLEHRTD